MTPHKLWVRAGRALLPAFAVLGLALLSVLLGPPQTSPSELVEAVWSAGSNDAAVVLWQLRAPRAVIALVAGGGLGVVGLLMQDVFGNPLAGPDLLGAGPGAALVMVVTVVTGVGGGFVLGPAVTLAGALGGSLIVLVLSARQRDPVRFAVVGAAVSAGLTALTIAVISVGGSMSTNLLFRYILGMLAGRTWAMAAPVLVGAVVLVVCVVPLARAAAVVRSGERLAAGVGIRPGRVVVEVVVLSSLVTATVVAACGPVPFVALLAPFLTRSVLRREGTMSLVWPTAVVGGLLLLTADTVGRLIAYPQEVPAGVGVAVLGGPALLVLLRGLRTTPARGLVSTG
ncbi:FecCD family ABC transporter permease [Pseudonocardia sp. CA-107938]|uniref:FecCD family ABC transporter permease n=1 Tax=Pseudonocardia sp. CA-107938 TaxID=3240021 RepID=UPI003D8E72BD